MSDTTTSTPQPPQQYLARFEDKIVYNEKFVKFSFELEKPPRMPFLAGQYVSIKVNESGERRSYSICSTPDIQHGFEVLVDVTPAGLGSQYLSQLQFGSQVEVLGPMGAFVVPENSSEAESEVVLVATGSGISPMRAMVLDLLQVRRDPRPITLHWGLRYANELFWEDEFQQLSEAFENFQFHPVMSRAVEQWPLCRGRVTDCLSIHGVNPEAGYYLCGNQNMIQDTAALLTQKGVEQSRIHHEKFY